MGLSAVVYSLLKEKEEGFRKEVMSARKDYVQAVEKFNEKFTSGEYEKLHLLQNDYTNKKTRLLNFIRIIKIEQYRRGEESSVSLAETLAVSWEEIPNDSRVIVGKIPTVTHNDLCYTAKLDNYIKEYDDLMRQEEEDNKSLELYRNTLVSELSDIRDRNDKVATDVISEYGYKEEYYFCKVNTLHGFICDNDIIRDNNMSLGYETEEDRKGDNPETILFTYENLKLLEKIVNLVSEEINSIPKESRYINTPIDDTKIGIFVKELEQFCDENLPIREGFFFGSREYDENYENQIETLKSFITNIEKPEEKVFFYVSSY